MAPFDLDASLSAIDDGTPEDLFSLSFDGNSQDSGTAPASNDYPAGYSVSLPTNSGALVKAGFTFIGWNTQADGLGSHYAVGDPISMPAADLVLYADWTTAPTYTVTYTTLDADSGSAPIDGNNYLATATVTVQGPGALVRADYLLTGWTDGTNTYPVSTGTFSMPAANVTLDPVWTPSYNVNYLATGADSGTPPTDSAEYLPGDVVTVLGNPGALDQTAGTWTGWDDGTNSYVAGNTFTMPAADVAMTPTFTADPTYTVSYTALNADSGTPPTDANNYLVSDPVSVAGSGSLVRLGYVLTDWTDGTNTYPESAGTFSMPAANVTLDPVWTANPYDVVFDANGGTGTMANQAIIFGTSANLTANTFTRAGHTFAGWNTAADGSGTGYADGASFTMNVTGIPLFAQWVLDISGGGSGSGVDPYIILTADDLNNVRYDLGASYEVGANIDLGSSPWGTGTGWVPIGNSGTPFTGSFDGGYPSFTINGLYINDPAADDAGLFGTTDNAAIQNVGLNSVSIAAGDRVGALVAVTNGNTTIIDSYATGVMSVGNWSGGLVANLRDTSVVRRSFVDITITGANYVGAFAGQMWDTAAVEDSFSVGSILGSGTVGGFISQINSTTSVVRSYAAVEMLSADDSFADYDVGTLTDNYYDVDNTGSTSGKATALTAGQMTQQASFSGWDFASVWQVDPAVSYPHHQWYVGPPPTPPTFAGGDGSSGNPYQINGPHGLVAISSDLAAHYVLVSDIDLGVPPYNTGAGWDPIGSVPAFSGTLDGGGNVIRNLFINTTVNQAGLFGRSVGGIVRDLGLENVDITSSGANVGAIVGQSDNGGGLTIVSSYATGSVTATSSVAVNIGGLAGWATELFIYSSFADVVVNAPNAYTTGGAGGMAGRNSNGGIYNSYAVGSVNGADNVGGLVGINSSPIETSYAAGAVSGTGANLGGLVGDNSGLITNSYYDLDTTNQTGFGTGLTTLQMIDSGNFVGFDFGAVWQIDLGVSYPYHQGYAGPVPTP